MSILNSHDCQSVVRRTNVELAHIHRKSLKEVDDSSSEKSSSHIVLTTGKTVLQVGCHVHRSQHSRIEAKRAAVGDTGSSAKCIGRQRKTVDGKVDFVQIPTTKRRHEESGRSRYIRTDGWIENHTRRYHRDIFGRVAIATAVIQQT